MDRRGALGFLAASAAALALPSRAQEPAMQARPVPATGERIPVVGLGTWITFDVQEAAARRARGDILQAFLAGGGRLVDSSPMYGAAEEVVGEQFARLGSPALFSATKVWTLGGLAGRRQMENSFRLWKAKRLDLMQVHNLLDWEAHWPLLRAWKAEGRLRYIGITTSHGRRHDELVRIMRRERLDFVQVSYSLADRDAERDILPVAAERGVAVIANRPFDGGAMFGARTAKPLPGWAREIGCASWAEVFLKWIAAHPAVTCAIPATSQLAHVRENVRALAGPLPDAALRTRILQDYERA
jgi:diketogulonate reductase-like aldo/keto reductase